MNIIVDFRHMRCGQCKVRMKDELAECCPHCKATFDGVTSNHVGLAERLRKIRGHVSCVDDISERYPDLVGG